MIALLSGPHRIENRVRREPFAHAQEIGRVGDHFDRRAGLCGSFLPERDRLDVSLRISQRPSRGIDTRFGRRVRGMLGMIPNQP
jgi:hypothetical protein